jgi:hypothetical protein
LIGVAYIAVSRATSGLKLQNKQQLVSRSQEIARMIDRVYNEEKKIAISLATNPIIVQAVKDHLDSSSVGAASKNTPNNAIQMAQDIISSVGDKKEISCAYEALNLVGGEGISFITTHPKVSRIDLPGRGYFKIARCGQTTVEGGSARDARIWRV